MKQQSVVMLDPIRQNPGREDGLLGKLLKTRWAGGDKITNNYPFGLYIFCGGQGSGKTVSAIWYMERLRAQYGKKGYNVRVWSNTPLNGLEYTSTDFRNVYDTIYNIPETNEDINIFILDELQVYFPRETKNKDKQLLISQFLDIMGQLRKRRVFILGVAQIFGRVDKSFREQALYMIDCEKNLFKTKLINYFIPAENILCDDLGRWSGKSRVIYRHGLPKTKFNTRFIVRAEETKFPRLEVEPAPSPLKGLEQETLTPHSMGSVSGHKQISIDYRPTYARIEL
ncbi:AAA family ATPase [Candidatus Saccharibacteria bacterium]|nr:AAA family ATPase [Candidatus Saccharibacteria bacterium]